MKKLKVIFDWFLRVGLSVIVVLFLVVAPFSLFESLLKAEADVNRGEVYEYQGILELWHIETFEGGSVSREKFLEKEALQFEKEHKGTYIVIQTMNLEQFELNLQNGKKPNIISFGIGACDKVVSNLIELDAENVRSDLAGFGKYGSRQLAVPYILGGYAMIAKVNGVVGVGLKGTTNPFKALSQNNLQIASLYDDKNLDSYDAYDKFLKNGFDVLLGTQRDVYRVYSRQQKGLLTDASLTFLGGYSDLVQYISVFKGQDIEETICKKFVSQLVSQNAQRRLKDYNLFSTLKNISLYDAGIYKDFENVLSQPLKSENAFISKSQIEMQKDDSYKKAVK